MIGGRCRALRARLTKKSRDSVTPLTHAVRQDSMAPATAGASASGFILPSGQDATFFGKSAAARLEPLRRRPLPGRLGVADKRGLPTPAPCTTDVEKKPSL